MKMGHPDTPTIEEYLEEVIMMPLTMLNSGETAEIKRIKGRDDVKRFLENLGFVTGEEVRVVSSNEGNIIVQVKDSRVAVSKGIANKIMI